MKQHLILSHLKELLILLMFPVNIKINDNKLWFEINEELPENIILDIEVYI